MSFIVGSLAAIALAAAAYVAPAQAQRGEPIKIGFSMAITGPGAGAGKPALIAMQVWEADINARGGLLGRPVKLVYYDDQTNPANVPGIYSKLLDVDKVDLVVGPYGTNMIAPAMPVVMQKNKAFISLFGTAVNEKFKYPRYFSMLATGPDPKTAFTKGFFDTAMAQNPKPQTVAIASANAEFGQVVADGARENAKAAGLRIVYDQKFPPNPTDAAPMVRAIQAANPDIVVICSYPQGSAAFVRAINELGYKPKMIGGGMVGLQFTALKMQLGPLLNGIVNYDTWIPAKTLQYPGSLEVVRKYQEAAAKQGADPLGYYLPPWAYAYLQVLEQAVTGTKSLDDAKLADYMHKNTFKTVVGDVKFGPLGEWTEPRFLTVQYVGIKGNTLDELKDMSKITVLAPADVATGKVVYPYEKAK
jgi:branched-chain amino acid transport system substrate-binding protein